MIKILSTSILAILISVNCFAQTEDDKLKNFADGEFAKNNVSSTFAKAIDINTYQQCKFAASIGLIESGSIADKEKRMTSKFIWIMMSKALDNAERRLIAKGISKRDLDNLAEPYMNKMIMLKKSGNSKELNKILGDCRNKVEDLLYILGYN